MAPDILRHRIILSYEAEAEGKTTDDIIANLLERMKCWKPDRAGRADDEMLNQEARCSQF
jgi:hypothetical protein